MAHFHHQPQSLLLSLPQELLEYIAVYVVLHHQHDPRFIPRRPLIPVLQACKRLNHILSPSSPLSHALYHQLFSQLFDTSAVRRRAFEPRSTEFRDQFITYCDALATIDQQDVAAMMAPDALTTAFIMLLENDGKNMLRLESVGTYSLAKTWVLNRAFVGSSRRMNEGWPEANPSTASALWIMWMMTTQDRLQNEDATERQHFNQHILPFATIPYRYPSADVPHRFTIPPPRPSTLANHNHPFHESLIPTAHGVYPVERSNTSESQFFYSSRPSFATPLASTAAKLLYACRRELSGLPIPPHLRATRAQADTEGIIDPGPTAEDIHEVNNGKAARLTLRASKGIDGPYLSRLWDCDWNRALHCLNYEAPKKIPWRRKGRTHHPGSLTGEWQGLMLFPNNIDPIIRDAIFPADGVTEESIFLASKPFFIQFEEHHQFFPNEPIPSHDASPPVVTESTPGVSQPLPSDEEIKNAWFPQKPTFPPTYEAHSSHFHIPPPHPNVPLTMFRPTMNGATGKQDGVVVNYQSNGRTTEKTYKTWVADQVPPGGAQGNPAGSRGNVHYSEHGSGFGSDGCKHCHAREQWEEQREKAEAIEKEERKQQHMQARAMRLDRRDEVIFESVGLGRDYKDDNADMDEDGDGRTELSDSDSDFVDDGDGDLGIRDATGRLVLAGTRPAHDDYDYDVDMQDATLDEDGDSSMSTTDHEGGHTIQRHRRHGKNRVAPRPRQSTSCHGIRDIIITGTVNRKHSMAWDSYTYFGRIREWDGLIGIIRRCKKDGVGDLFMFGYIVGGAGVEELDLSVANGLGANRPGGLGSTATEIGVGSGGAPVLSTPPAPAGTQSQAPATFLGSPGCFVGNWRTLSEDPRHPPYECAFVMSRRS